jgi:hypothetical protein
MLHVGATGIEEEAEEEEEEEEGFTVIQYFYYIGLYSELRTVSIKNYTQMNK